MQFLKFSLKNFSAMFSFFELDLQTSLNIKKRLWRLSVSLGPDIMQFNWFIYQKISNIVTYNENQATFFTCRIYVSKFTINES